MASSILPAAMGHGPLRERGRRAGRAPFSSLSSPYSNDGDKGRIVAKTKDNAAKGGVEMVVVVTGRIFPAKTSTLHALANSLTGLEVVPSLSVRGSTAHQTLNRQPRRWDRPARC